jgi:hypothetical protein
LRASLREIQRGAALMRSLSKNRKFLQQVSSVEKRSSSRASKIFSALWVFIQKELPAKVTVVDVKETCLVSCTLNSFVAQQNRLIQGNQAIIAEALKVLSLRPNKRLTASQQRKIRSRTQALKARVDEYRNLVLFQIPSTGCIK